MAPWKVDPSAVEDALVLPLLVHWSTDSGFARSD